MPARLSVFFPDRPVRRRILADGEGCLIGRGDGCGLPLDDSRVSRRHARLAPSAGGWRLEDLGSKNGTLVDGEPPSDGALPDYAWITLGGLPVRFERLSDDDRRLAVERDRERWHTSVLMQRRIDPSAGLGTVLEQTLAAVIGLCEAERAGVVLVGADGGLEVAAATGEEPLSAAPERGAGEPDRPIDATAFAGSRGAIERALSSGRPLTLSDVRSDSGLGGRASVVAGGLRALVCLPLSVLGRTIGALYADSRRSGGAFTELDVEVLEALAHHAALAVAVSRLQGELAGLRAELPTQVAPAAAAGASAGDPLAAAWDRALPAWTPSFSVAGAGTGAGTEGEAPEEEEAGADRATRAIRGRAAAGR